MTEIIRIDAETWRIEDGFVRFFLLEGSEKAAMVDSGVASSDALDIAKKLTDKEVMLINTHGDGDHTSGTASFDRIYMHEADYLNCRMAAKYPDTKLEKLTDGEVIDLGGRPIRMIHIPGHTKGSLALLDVNKRALYSGDSVQNGHIYMFGDHRDPEDFEASLDKLISISCEYDVIYASHDEFSIQADYVGKVKAAWKKVLSGEVPYETQNIKGNIIRSFTTEDCGFYMK